MTKKTNQFASSVNKSHQMIRRGNVFINLIAWGVSLFVQELIKAETLFFIRRAILKGTVSSGLIFPAVKTAPVMPSTPHLFNVSGNF